MMNEDETLAIFKHRHRFLLFTFAFWLAWKTWNAFCGGWPACLDNWAVDLSPESEECGRERRVTCLIVEFAGWRLEVPNGGSSWRQLGSLDFPYRWRCGPRATEMCCCYYSCSWVVCAKAGSSLSCGCLTEAVLLCDCYSVVICCQDCWKWWVGCGGLVAARGTVISSCPRVVDSFREV